MPDIEQAQRNPDAPTNAGYNYKLFYMLLLFCLFGSSISLFAYKGITDIFDYEFKPLYAILYAIIGGVFFCNIYLCCFNSTELRNS